MASFTSHWRRRFDFFDKSWHVAFPLVLVLLPALALVSFPISLFLLKDSVDKISGMALGQNSSPPIALSSQKSFDSYIPAFAGVVVNDLGHDVNFDLRVDRPVHLRDYAIIVLAHNRPNYLGYVLSHLKSLAEIDSYNVYTSQDGEHEGVAKVMQSQSSWVSVLQRLHHPLQRRGQSGDAFTAQHYKWTLDHVFANGHTHAILMEDDLVPSPDFLSYFNQTRHLLDVDPTIWCITSWHDNGIKGASRDLRRLYRTDHFPGLGWMLKRSLWLELSPNFALDSWDWWMRNDLNSKGRSCVYPEVSRNRNIGIHGVHAGLFSAGGADDDELNKDSNAFALNPFNSNEKQVDLGDLSYLHKPEYDVWIRSLGSRAKLLTLDELLATDKSFETSASASTEVFLTPVHLEDYLAISNRFGFGAHIQRRDTYEGNIIFPIRRGYLILADVHFSSLLPEAYQKHPHPKAVKVVGNIGESCSTSCSRAQMHCDDEEFVYINNCKTAVKHLKCWRGCWYGLDQEDHPAMISSSKDELFDGFCLASGGKSQCDRSRPGAIRLCVCIPPP